MFLYLSLGFTDCFCVSVCIVKHFFALSTTIFNNPLAFKGLGFLGHGLAMLARRMT
jgi:hypothetical protein